MNGRTDLPLSGNIVRLMGLLLLSGTLGTASAASLPAGVQPLVNEADALYASYDQDPARLDRAIALYEQALALAPADYTLLWNLAEMYQSKGQMLPADRRDAKIAAWDRGAVYGRRAVEANPGGKEGHYYLMANEGAAAQLQGLLRSIWKFRGIKKQLDRTAALDPDWPPVLVARAQYLTEMPGIFGGSTKEAEALYRRAIALDPHCSVAHYFLGELLARQERYEEAAATLEALIRCRDPGHRANWAVVDVPRARRLLQQIREKTGTSGGPPSPPDPGDG